MLRAERYRHFVEYFSAHQPNAETELHYGNAFQLLIAVILSAQCTDKRINLVTPAIFRDFPTPESLAAATAEEIFEYIRSVSYPNNKSKHLVGMAKMLVDVFHGEVPSDINELQKLPGVGRKTANVIASVVYEAPAMAVDTHVFRVANRIGLVNNAKTPLAVEKQLVEFLPKDTLRFAHHWLILHGRYICLARNPKCEICPINWFCRYYERTHTEAALKRAEAVKAKKVKEQQKKKRLNTIAKELKKRSVDKDI
ncbi:MAG TPA: endonuclease III [Mucilaginibacter sp.]|nr:endonuclease III [Mucilaginibacter sp.]HVW12385.1 endonuclease III [Mucilaginibacter sp.]